MISPLRANGGAKGRWEPDIKEDIVEELRYPTVEEIEEYKRLAKEYGIKGYSPQITMIYPSQSILRNRP